MLHIYKVSLTPEVAQVLIGLSGLWEQEDSCFGYRKNTLDDIKNEEIYLAREESQIIGYLLCHRYTQKSESCTVPKDSPCLEMEELYILPEYRSRGIGGKLFQFAVDQHDGDVKYVTLSTATRNYKAILHFYIEELGMTFWNARLFKKLG